jgi:hypothetical protein
MNSQHNTDLNVTNLAQSALFIYFMHAVHNYVVLVLFIIIVAVITIAVIVTTTIIMDVTAQSLMALKSCHGIFKDAMTSDAFICIISPVIGRPLLYSSSKHSSPFLSMALKFSYLHPQNAFQVDYSPLLTFIFIFSSVVHFVPQHGISVLQHSC